MAANNTPLPDLIELSSINANATFTTTPGGGGDILGVVDTATYTDGDPTNSPTQIGELNETFSGNGGTLTIDGVEYNIQLIAPDGFGDDVTVSYNNGASSVDLAGDGGDSEVVFIVASPLGGGSDRFFAAIDDGIGDLPGITSIQTRGLDFDPAGDDVKINLDQNQNVAPICFTPGARILTTLGAVPVELLKPGAKVLTIDDGPQPIRWIGRRTMVFGPKTEKHKPVQIKAGALGAGAPVRDMAVSPQHRVLVEGRAVRRHFGVDQVFARAKGLANMPGIRVMKAIPYTNYISLLLDQHHVITAEGLRTESFYPGPMALRQLKRGQRRQVETILPKLREDPCTGYGPTARLVLRNRETAFLAQNMKDRPAISQAEKAKYVLEVDPTKTAGFAIAAHGCKQEPLDDIRSATQTAAARRRGFARHNPDKREAQQGCSILAAAKTF